VKRLSYIEDARCLKVKLGIPETPYIWYGLNSSLLTNSGTCSVFKAPDVT